MHARGSCSACWTFPLIEAWALGCSTMEAVKTMRVHFRGLSRVARAQPMARPARNSCGASAAKSVTGDDVRALVSDFVKAECPAGADGQVERVAHRLGLVAVAGELAITTSVVPWRAGEARQAAAWALRAWLANRGGTQPAEVRQAIQQVRLYIEQHGDSRFDPLDSVEAKPSPNRAGWRKGEGEEREWLIPPETWKAEICAGLDPGFVARTLAEHGLIERASDGFQPVRRIGGSNKRVYVLNARIFAGGGYDA